MIPPLAPGQIDEQQDMVGWRNTFNMRQVNLMNLAASHIGTRNGCLSELSSYRRTHCMTGPAKSLDLLRKNLQNAINRDIDNVIKKYLEKFFQPAINNIKINLGKDSVSEDHVKDVCRQILEEAKSMYRVCPMSRESSPYDCSDSESGSIIDRKFNYAHSKRKESDTDSETNMTQLKKHKLRVSHPTENYMHKLPSKREGPKWDPQRVTQNTLFIMGAKANKVLGYGQTRGRLYVRHPELVRYSGDQEDKEWLSAKNLMPPSGGKAYLMLLEDIYELTQSDEYKNSPHLQLHELKGFEVPPFLSNKIRAFMENVRTDKKASSSLFDSFELSRHNPTVTGVDSAPSTPSDTLQMIESQSVSTTSSKHSENNFIHIPEMSPGSNNSLMSSQLTQSPLSVSGNLLSPNVSLPLGNSDVSNGNGSVMMLSGEHHRCLSSLLARHVSSDSSQEF